VASELNALASTRPVDAMPELEAYYLDPAKQAEVRERSRRFAGDVDPRHLHGSGRRPTLRSRPTSTAVDRGSPSLGRAGDRLALRGERGVEVETVNRRRRLLAKDGTETIAAVRGIYHGELTYAANFDQYQAVGFWPSLDLIGVNAYFPLRAHSIVKSEGGLDRARARGLLARILERLDAFRTEAGAAGHPCIFTELGYTCRVNSTIEPWSSRGFSLIGDWEHPELMVWDERRAQLRGARARGARACAAPRPRFDPELLRGLLWWKLSTVTAHDAIEPFVLLIRRGRAARPVDRRAPRVSERSWEVTAAGLGGARGPGGGRRKCFLSAARRQP
jgi:hypothetical protein